MNGIGTLVYSWITKGGIPAYLGSSFAFIAPSLVFWGLDKVTIQLAVGFSQRL